MHWLLPMHWLPAMHEILCSIMLFFLTYTPYVASGSRKPLCMLIMRFDGIPLYMAMCWCIHAGDRIQLMCWSIDACTLMCRLSCGQSCGVQWCDCDTIHFICLTLWRHALMYAVLGLFKQRFGSCHSNMDNIVYLALWKLLCMLIEDMPMLLGFV